MLVNEHPCTGTGRIVSRGIEKAPCLKTSDLNLKSPNGIAAAREHGGCADAYQWHSVAMASRLLAVVLAADTHRRSMSSV